MVKCLTSQYPPRRPIIRWTTLKGLIAIIVFLAVAIFAEYLVVLYSMSLGVKDAGILRINWPFTIAISPMFQLVPAAVIITLLFTWMYFANILSTKPPQTTAKPWASSARRAEMKQLMSKASQTAKSSLGKTKPSRMGVRGLSYLWEKIYSARATIKSALTVFLGFLALLLIISLLAYPALLYRTIMSAYQNKSLLYGFVVATSNALRGFAKAVSPIGWIATAINSGLLALAPGIGTIGLGLGSLIDPLANLDPAGKYLVFQNAAAWISVLFVLFYGHYGRRIYRYRKK